MTPPHLPHANQAVVPPRKLTGYLLSESHPVGRSKARFFRAAGFNAANAAELGRGLLAIAARAPVVTQSVSPYGVKYVIDGRLSTPRGGTVRLRTIWIVEAGTDAPRLVTAYPYPEQPEPD